MSVFTVDMSNSRQGLLDVDVNGKPVAKSIQRTMMVTGPNRIQRQLKDGDVFTGCNYWKQFAYPQVPLDQAFIVVTTDDGSIWSNDPMENTVIASWYPGTNGILTGGTAFGGTNMTLDLSATPAKFMQIQNNGGSGVGCKVRINGSATFNLEGNMSQIFNPGDIVITKVELDNSLSGAGSALIQVIYSYESNATS